MATRFYVYLKQEQGCDYTLGCGVKLIEIDATSMEEVHDKILAEYEYLFTAPDRYERLVEFNILEVTEVHRMDTTKIAKGLLAKRKAELAGEQEAHERALLAQLQAKYGAKESD